MLSSARKTASPDLSRRSALLPYRENGTVKYAAPPALSAPAGTSIGSLATSSVRSVPYIPGQVLSYDSDAEPLISSDPEPLDEEAIQRFTATGRPMPQFKHNGLQNLGSGWGLSVPQLLPRRYTDDSIIPAIVMNFVPKAIPDSPPKKSFFKLPTLAKKLDKPVKIVYMPRRDYQKYFARGLQGEYIGSEPLKLWTEEELEETWGRHKPVVRRAKRESLVAK